MYPRGFLGDNGAQPQAARTPSAFQEELKQRIQYRVSDRTDAKHSIASNSHVEVLYAQYIKRSTNTGSFEFRRQVLSTALFAFGTFRFKSWYLSQHQSPPCGDLHNRFLTDTLKFISTGKREMSLETWAALLSMSDEGNSIGLPSPYSEEFFNYDHYINLVDVLQEWCCKPNGLEDLLGTLHILFGNP